MKDKTYHREIERCPYKIMIDCLLKAGISPDTPNIILKVLRQTFGEKFNDDFKKNYWQICKELCMENEENDNKLGLYHQCLKKKKKNFKEKKRTNIFFKT